MGLLVVKFGGGSTKRVREVVDQVRERTFPYQHRPRARVPWRLYDKAQRQEFPEMLGLIQGLVDRWAWERPKEAATPPHPKGGQPPVPLPDRLKALLAQSYLGLPNRPTEGEVTALREVLGISRYFGHKTVERSYGDPRVVAALHDLFELTNRPVQGLEALFAADGHGSPTAIGQHYRSTRERQRGKERESGLLPGAQGHHDWVYSEATVGMRFGLIAAWVSWTDHRVGEPGKFEGLARRTKELHPEWSGFLGDGGYSARWVVGLLDRIGVQSWILPRRNVRLTSLGEPAWPMSLRGLAQDPQEWLSVHFRRVRIEATWWSVESRNPGRIRKRIPFRRETETMLRGVVRNLRRLCYLRWLEADPKFTAFAPYAS